MPSLHHKPQSRMSQLADHLMEPLMYLLSGTWREVPQRTHWWNNIKYDAAAIRFLDSAMMVSEEMDGEARPRWFGIVPLFHIPIFGGWKKFIVLEPVVKQDIWYVGWVAEDVIGISQITLTNQVRVLQGPSTVQFFGINEHGAQIKLRKVGMGTVGNSGVFSRVPLL